MRLIAWAFYALCLAGLLGCGGPRRVVVHGTLVEKGERLLGGVDREISELMREQLRGAGINVLLRNEVASVSGPERETVEVTLKNGGELTVTGNGLRAAGSGTVEDFAEFSFGFGYSPLALGLGKPHAANSHH